VLKAVRVGFLPENQQPKVELTAPTDGVAVSKKVEMKWKAQDADKDTLVHKVYTSNDGGETWEAVEEDLDEPEYEWDTEKLDDGRYAVKVVVSDELSNPGSPRTAEVIAEPVLVDNTAPSVIEREVGDVSEDKTVTISGLAIDHTTPITAIEYRVGDEGKYRGVAPGDGIYDSREERFSFTTEKLDPGEQEMQLRVRDAAGNWFEDTVKVEVPGEPAEDKEPKAEAATEEEEPEPDEEGAEAEKPAEAKKKRGRSQADARRAPKASTTGSDEGK